MPDLNLSEDRKQYQDLARDFAQNEIAPKAADLDHRAEFPSALIKQAWEIGLLNVLIPEEFGGMGLGSFDACVIAEELGAACAGVGSAFFGNDLAVVPILVAGNPAQKQQLLAPAIESFSLAAFAFESDSLHWKKEGGNYLLTGTAQAINAQNATWLLIQATNEKGEEPTLFALTLEDAKSMSVKAAPRVGLKAADLTEVKFANRSVTEDAVIGKPGEGQKILEAAQTKYLPVLASFAIGLTKSALTHATKYSTERHTFGQPIANHQAVSFLLADMAKDIEAGRFLARKAAWLADENQGDRKLSRMAHLFSCQSAIKATIDAVQVFGGYGYSREYPVEKLMRDAKMLQLYGANEAETRLDIGKELVASAV